MTKYKDFIPENIAPKEAERIGLYNSDGKRVGVIPLGALSFPNAGQKLYSFGALSDVHIGYDTAEQDFRNALLYLDKNVDFTCVCGDLTGQGSIEQLQRYKDICTENWSRVYSIAGNHEGMNTDIDRIIMNFTGNSLYYSFTYDEDVFIMVGTIGGEMYSNGVLFIEGELKWLYETLEANRNKRCFVFQHIFPGIEKEKTCGNAAGMYTNWCWHDTKECNIFLDLMKHYKNVVWFHGHSHLKYNLQKYKQLYANYSKDDGYRSVHISSLAVPRDDINGDGIGDSIYAESEGAIVEVYKNGIYLRGRDFAYNNYEGKWIPAASYWIDTSLQEISKNSYGGLLPA